MKKIIIILISLSIIGIIVFLYIDNINMDYKYYINESNVTYHVDSFQMERDNYASPFLPSYDVKELIDNTHNKLASLQKRNNIIYTILLILSVTDTALIFTIKNKNKE